MRTHGWLMALVMTACGGSATDVPAPNPDVTAQDATIAETAGDAAVADTADAAQGFDTAADSAAVDTGPADTGPADIATDAALQDGVADGTQVDAAAADAGAPDIASPDTGPDTGPDLPPKESEFGGPCSAETACKFPSCIAPGQSPGCGICKQIEDSCQTDADCAKAGAIQVCKKVTCACGGESACQDGCVGNDACAEGQFCAPTGHCVALVCKKVGQDDASCPANFECQDPANPKCQRKACTASSQCKGACVKGFCYDKPGTCMPPPP